MKRNEDAICSTCPYWDELDHMDGGICKRYPGQRIVSDDFEWIVNQPKKEAYDWCGKHPDIMG